MSPPAAARRDVGGASAHLRRPSVRQPVPVRSTHQTLDAEALAGGQRRRASVSTCTAGGASGRAARGSSVWSAEARGIAGRPSESDLHDDVRRTKETCENIQDKLDRMAGLEAKPQGSPGPPGSSPVLAPSAPPASPLLVDAEAKDPNERWRRLGRLEGEVLKAKEVEQAAALKRAEYESTLAAERVALQKASASARAQGQEEVEQLRRRSEEQEGEMRDLRGALRNKDEMIQELTRSGDEWARALDDAAKLEQECNHRREELERSNEDIERRNRTLERDLTMWKARHNDLERLLDESAAEASKAQKRHEELVEKLQGQLASGEAEQRVWQQEQAHRRKEEDSEKRSAFVALEASLEHRQASFELELKEQKRQQAELETQRQQFDQEVAEFKVRDRASAAAKENKQLREMVQEQKRLLSELEGELRRDREATLAQQTPGDYLRMVRQREGDVFSKDNVRYAMQNKRLEHNLQVCQQAFSKHMPAATKAPLLGGC